MINIEIGKNEQNQRLDKFLRKYLGRAPLSYIYKAIRKDVKVNGKRSREDYLLQMGDTVTLYMADDVIENYRKKVETVKIKRQFRIAYEDENVMIVEKPLGLLTHGDQHEHRNCQCQELFHSDLHNKSSFYLFSQFNYNKFF